MVPLAILSIELVQNIGQVTFFTARPICVAAAADGSKRTRSPPIVRSTSFSVRPKRGQWLDFRSTPCGNGCCENRHTQQDAVIAPSTNGSFGVTPKSNVDISLASAREATRPIRIPAPANRTPCASTSRRICNRLAPRAMRTPISPMRWPTRKERSPYRPAAANTTAAAANKLTRRRMNRLATVTSSTKEFRGRISATDTDPSMDVTACRIPGPSDDASRLLLMTTATRVGTYRSWFSRKSKSS